MERSTEVHIQPKDRMPTCKVAQAGLGFIEAGLEPSADWWRGWLFGALLGLVVGSGIARHRGHRSVLLLETPLGSVRLSQHALKRLIEDRCSRVPGIGSTSVQVRSRSNRTVVTMQVEVQTLAAVIPAVTALEETLQPDVQDFMSLGSEDIDFVLSEIRLRSG